MLVLRHPLKWRSLPGTGEGGGGEARENYEGGGSGVWRKKWEGNISRCWRRIALHWHTAGSRPCDPPLQIGSLGRRRHHRPLHPPPICLSLGAVHVWGVSDWRVVSELATSLCALLGLQPCSCSLPTSTMVSSRLFLAVSIFLCRGGQVHLIVTTAVRQKIPQSRTVTVLSSNG